LYSLKSLVIVSGVLNLHGYATTAVAHAAPRWYIM
jgi:hypothetical protein